MTNPTSLFSRLVLALALATGAGAALAVPASYHISIDTSTLAGDGYLDLALAGFSPATALVSNFTGAASGASIVTGTASGDLATTATFDTSDVNYLDQLVHFGGVFSLDVLFDYAGASAGAGVDDSVAFALALYNTDFSAYLGANGPLATITLTPGLGTSFTTDGSLATLADTSAAAVPEPSAWLLMLIGLSAMGAMVRRRSL
jgi:hypothetical protein